MGKGLEIHEEKERSGVGSRVKDIDFGHSHGPRPETVKMMQSKAFAGHMWNTLLTASGRHVCD